MHKIYYEKIIIIGFVLLVMLPVIVEGQVAKSPCQRQDYYVNSGIYDGPRNAETKSVSVFQTSVQIPNATWLRLEFGDCNLGRESYITIRSLEDGGTQRLNAESLKQWYNHSAFFNGDAVAIELFAAPQDENIYFETSSVAYNIRDVSLPNMEKIASDYCNSKTNRGICGNYDDRVPSYDDAVGRLITITGNDTTAYGTAFIASNGTYLSSGHCFLLVDPVIIEFNVPLSDEYGEPVFASPDDQYSVNLSTERDQRLGIGGDWAVFECYPNSNTGLLPVQAQEDFFRLTIDVSNPETLRVTGYGYDICPPGAYNVYNQNNKIQQTSTGVSGGEFTGTGTKVYWQHYADIILGCSGGPLEIPDMDIAVGIHAQGTCPNHATSFENDDLEDAINDFPGSGTKYADVDHPAATDSGTVVRPYDTVEEAVNAVSAGGKVCIVSGSYDEDFTINKAVTLVAPVGNVTIGPSLAKNHKQGSGENNEKKSPDEENTNLNSEVPAEFTLSKNYPNPFNSQTTIKYALPRTCFVAITIYNMLGQEVRTLVNETQSEGFKSVVWDGKDNRGDIAPSGVYVYKISADTFTKSRRLSLLK